MIAADTAWDAMAADAGEEELQDGSGAIVGVDTDACDETRVAVDEAVNNEFPPDET